MTKTSQDVKENKAKEMQRSNNKAVIFLIAINLLVLVKLSIAHKGIYVKFAGDGDPLYTKKRSKLWE